MRIPSTGLTLRQLPVLHVEERHMATRTLLAVLRLIGYNSLDEAADPYGCAWPALPLKPCVIE